MKYLIAYCQGRYIFVVIDDHCFARQQRLDNIKGWRLTYIAHVAFVGYAQHKHSRTIEAATLLVERLADLIHDIVWHAAVDLRSQFDKASCVIERFELPGEIVRIDRNAVSSQARTRREGHEAEGLCRRGLNNLPY